MREKCTQDDDLCSPAEEMLPTRASSSSASPKPPPTEQGSSTEMKDGEGQNVDLSPSSQLSQTCLAAYRGHIERVRQARKLGMYGNSFNPKDKTALLVQLLNDANVQVRCMHACLHVGHLHRNQMMSVPH